jgi:arginase family enzyme
VNTLQGVHLNLDDAWPAELLGLPMVEARNRGPALRFSAPRRVVEEFYQEMGRKLPSFIVYGSGDFHYLTGLLVRRITEPFVLISFDNHPDWDVRPPRWGCGGWINRALELSFLRKVSVWGCGNFECWWPWRIFGNRRAEREGRLEVHPWADDRPVEARNRRGAILRENWRDRFKQFVSELERANIYVTIDLDCLRAEEAVTNWESGCFTLDDVRWALTQLRQSSGRIVGGDLCGAFSVPVYARAKQRFAAGMDHPKLPPINIHTAQEVNLRALEALWPILAH